MLYNVRINDSVYFAELDQNQMKFILDLMIIIHIVVMSSLTRFMLWMCESCSFAELRSEVSELERT